MKLSLLIDHLIASGIDVACEAKTADIEVERLSGLAEAGPTELSFFSDIKRAGELKETHAAAVLLKKENVELATCPTIVVEDPYYAYALIAQCLNPIVLEPAVHPSAVISASAIVPKSCQIDANVVISEDVFLGENVWIGANAYIGKNVTIGSQTHIYPNVTIMHGTVIGNQVSIESGTVIGGQGFGFAPHNGEWHRIPQTGKVLIEDKVWIGNNCSIDRGAINDTIIGENTIIDNLVHLAHNVVVGKGCAIVSQVGVSGSVTIGDHCVFAGQSGAAGHLNITDNVHLMARTGVTTSIDMPGAYGGFPHMPASDWQKKMARINRLEKTNARIKKLEEEFQELKKQLED